MGGRVPHGINVWDSPAHSAIVADKVGRHLSDGVPPVRPEQACAATGSANVPGFMGGKLQRGTSAWDNPGRFKTADEAAVGEVATVFPDKISVRIGIESARASTVGVRPLGLRAWVNLALFMIASEKVENISI